MSHAKTHLNTRAVHAGRPRGDGPVMPAIEMSTTFVRGPDGGYPSGFSYGRDGNPNRDQLEARIASLEGGAAAAAFASGTAASMAVFQALPRGSHIIASRGAYYGTVRQLTEIVRQWGYGVSVVDTTSVDVIRHEMHEDTALLWLETPNNPLLEIADIDACAALCHERGVLVAVDNTVASPVCQNPLALGADLVMHSSTKYLGGHSDVTGGLVVAAREDDTFRRIRAWQSTAGAVPSPFDCWLLTRSIMTLPCRVQAQMQGAAGIARFLDGHDAASRVHYPGLGSHPGHEIAARQMHGFGALLSFQLRGGEAAAWDVCRKVRLFTPATSLGGVESLIEHRASVEGPGTATPADLLRLSVGVEYVDDLIADLEQALS